jgi:predicted alpha-1,6-mannanase (GH76 family)
MIALYTIILFSMRFGGHREQNDTDLLKTGYFVICHNLEQQIKCHTRQPQQRNRTLITKMFIQQSKKQCGKSIFHKIMYYVDQMFYFISIVLFKTKYKLIFQSPNSPYNFCISTQAHIWLNCCLGQAHIE